MITFEALLIRRFAPVIRAPGKPMIVVLEPIGTLICADWTAAEARRASSSGPLGSSSQPQVAGS